MTRAWGPSSPFADLRRQPWRHRAACAHHEPHIFDGEDLVANRIAAGICANCPVREECLESALAEEVSSGVRGGVLFSLRGAVVQLRA